VKIFNLATTLKSFALKRPGYRPDIDGVRALAILPVILFHADLGCPGGFIGVDIFFVISGFLITTLILKELRADAFSLATFWERRIRRIFPALFVVIFATLIAGWFLYLPPDFDLLGQSVAAQALLLSNVFFYQHMGYFQPDSNAMPLLHTWSLAVEEQFYVIFPLLLIFLARHKRFSIAQIIFCLCICSLNLSVWGIKFNFSSSANFYLLPTRAWELMIGAFLAAIPRKQLFHARWNEAAGLAGLGLVLYAVFFYTRETEFPGLAAIPPCLGAALIIISGGATPTLVSRVLVLRPIVFVGLISYSLYLWHWPLLVFTRYISIEAQSWQLRVALLLASTVLAILTFTLIEVPFRRRLLCPQRSQIFALAGFSLLSLLVLGGGIYFKHGLACRLPAQALIFKSRQFDTTFWQAVWPIQAAAGQFPELGKQTTNQPIEILLWGGQPCHGRSPSGR
jgi:peptidoglycan/LPS O-acetylase OafA/YrhL